MVIKEYDWNRLNGLGFDLEFVEKTAKKAKKPDLAPMDRMAMAPGMEEEPVTKPSTFIMDEQPEMEPNGGMLITQLRSMAESVEEVLSMVNPDDNLPPWVASKISQASTSMESVANHLKFGEGS